MKVLITTDLYHVETNGVVTSVRNLKQELQKKGHEVRVLTVSQERRSHQECGVYSVKSVSIGKIYPDVRMPTSYRNAYIQELIEWKPDVIHSQCEFFSFQFARFISRKTGAPIVHTYHTLYEQYVTYVIPNQRVGAYFVGKLSRLRLRKTSAIVAPTHKVERVLQGYGIREPIHVVPSGIALEQYRSGMTAEARSSKRTALGIPEDHQVLLNLGRLGTEKNLTEVLSFFAAALEKNDCLTLLIVGDGPAKEMLRKQAEELGIQTHVIFTGMVEPEEVQAYYQLGDVFVSASTSETQGLTYIEAAANGLPLLCRQDPCLEEVLCPGENGYVYTNEAEFLQGLETILNDGQWREAAGKASIQIAASFGKDAFADAIEAVYTSVLEGLEEDPPGQKDLGA